MIQRKHLQEKMSLEKNPLYADKYQTIRVPEKVQTVEFETNLYYPKTGRSCFECG